MTMATIDPPATDRLNWTRHVPAQKRGHYESFYQRANHPTRPWAFWIRYTLFSPQSRPESAIGELWATFFDGETGEHVVAKEEYPLAECQFDRHAFSARVKDRLLLPGMLQGTCSSFGSALSWNLTYEGDQSPLFLLPGGFYRGSFPRAKSLVGLPLATYSGELVVGGRAIAVDNWVGSQNHNWGSKHTDYYAFGQVAGFDQAPQSFLEIVSAQVKIGPVWTPTLTFLVLRHPRTGVFARFAAGKPQGPGALRVFLLGLLLRIESRAHRGANRGNPGRLRWPQLLQPAGRYQALPEYQDRLLHADDPGQIHGAAGCPDDPASCPLRDPHRRP